MSQMNEVILDGTGAWGDRMAARRERRQERRDSRGGTFQERRAERTKSKTKRRAKRQQKRRERKKDQGFAGLVTQKVKGILRRGGDANEFAGGLVLTDPGNDAVLFKQGAVHILVIGPGAAIDEAVARFEFPDVAGEFPLENTGEYESVLVQRGDLTAGSPHLTGCATEMASYDGIGIPQQHGQTMGQCADIITGVIDAVAKLPEALASILPKLADAQVLKTIAQGGGKFMEVVQTGDGEVFEVVKNASGAIMSARKANQEGKTSEARPVVHNHYYPDPTSGLPQAIPGVGCSPPPVTVEHRGPMRDGCSAESAYIG